MKKRFSGILLSVCMIITMLPASAKVAEAGAAEQTMAYHRLIPAIQ